MEKSQQKKENHRKWSLGVFFRRKKNSNEVGRGSGGGRDCSSSEEDRKAGFNPRLSNHLTTTTTKASIIKSNHDNIDEQQLHDLQSLRNRPFIGIDQKMMGNRNAEGIHHSTKESACKISMEYITTPDLLINRSMGSLDRRIRRREKIRAIRICPKSNPSNNNDDEDMVSGNSSIISRFHSDDGAVSVHNRDVINYNINNQVIPSNSRKSRSARTERYLKRMSRGDVVVDSNKCPIHVSQQVGRWKTQPVIHRLQYFGSNISMEKDYTYGSEHNNNNQFALRNSSSLTNVPCAGFIQTDARNYNNWDSIDYLRKNKYPITNNSINDGNRSVSYENYMHRVSPPLLAIATVPSTRSPPIARTDLYNRAMIQQQPAPPPPPPPRDPERRLKINNLLGESRPVSYAFDRSDTMTNTVRKPSINNRSVSDDKIWGSTHSEINCVKKRLLATQPNCTVGGRQHMNKRFITRTGVGSSPRSKNETYYIHQNDNVFMQPAQMTRTNKNSVSSSSGLTAEQNNPALSSLFVAPKLSAASEFWKRIDEAESSRRCRPTEKIRLPAVMKPRSSSAHSRAQSIIYDSNTALNDLYLEVGEKIGADIISNTVVNDDDDVAKYIRTTTEQHFIEPSRTLKKDAFNEFEFLNKTKSMPSYYGTKNRSLAITPVNKYEEHVARTISKPQKSFNYKSKPVNYVTNIRLPPLKYGVLSFQVPQTHTKKSIEPLSQKMVTSTMERESKIDRKSTNLEDAINELEEIYKSLHLGNEDILDGAQLRDIPTPIVLLQRPTTKHPIISDEDIDDERNADEPDIILDDLVYRNIKHSNSSPKVVDTQPPFGIPLGPISPSPTTTHYLHVHKSSDYKTSFDSDNLRHRSPDIVSDDLAVRSLRKDNCSSFHKSDAQFLQCSSGALVNLKKKQRAIRSQSANIYNLIQCDTSKSSSGGGTFDDYLSLNDSKLSKTESLKNIFGDDHHTENDEQFKINQDHPSNVLILKRESDNRKNLNSLPISKRITENSNNVNAVTPHAGGFGAVFKLPSTLKTSPIIINHPYIPQRNNSSSGSVISNNQPHMALSPKKCISPDMLHSDNTNMEELLNAIAKEAQESSEKLSRDLIELRKESKSLSSCRSSPNLKLNNTTKHTDQTNGVGSKQMVVINVDNDVVSRTDKLNGESVNNNNIVNYEPIDMIKKKKNTEVTINPPYHETDNEKLKSIEPILVGMMVHNNIKMNTELPPNIPIIDQHGITKNKLSTEKAFECSTSVGHLFKQSLGIKGNNIDVIADRCMNQISALGELKDDIVVKVSAPIKSDSRTIDDGNNTSITEIQTLNLPINNIVGTVDCHDYDNLIAHINRPLDLKFTNLLIARDNPNPKHIHSSVTNEQAIQKEIDIIMKECAEEAEKIKVISSLSSVNRKCRSSEDELNIILLPEQQKQQILLIDKETGDDLFLSHPNPRVVSSPIFIGSDHLKNSSSDCFKSSSATPNRLNTSSVTSFYLGELQSSSEYIKSPISSDNHQLSEDIKTNSTTSYDVKSTTLPSVNDDDDDGSIASSVISSLKSRTVSPISQSPALTPSLLDENESKYNSVEELALIFGINRRTSSSLEPQSQPSSTSKIKENQNNELLISIFNKRNQHIKLTKDPELNSTTIDLQQKPKTIANFKSFDLRPKSVLFDIIYNEKVNGSSKILNNTDMEPLINHSDIVNKLHPIKHESAESLLIRYHQEIEDASLLQYNKIKRNLVIKQPIKNNTIKSNLNNINKCDVYNDKKCSNNSSISKSNDTTKALPKPSINHDTKDFKDRKNLRSSTLKMSSTETTTASPNSVPQFSINNASNSSPMIKQHSKNSKSSSSSRSSSKNLSQSIIRTTKASRLRAAVLDTKMKGSSMRRQLPIITNNNNNNNGTFIIRENVSSVKKIKELTQKLVPIIDVVSVSQILNDVIYPIDKMDCVTSVTIPNNQLASGIVATDTQIPEDSQLTTAIINLKGGMYTVKSLPQGTQERDKSSKRKSYLNRAHNSENMPGLASASERHVVDRCVLENRQPSPVLSLSEYAAIFKDVSSSPTSLSKKQQQQQQSAVFTQLPEQHQEPYRNEFYTSSKYLFMANDRKQATPSIELNRSNTISPTSTQTNSNLECRIKQQPINRNIQSNQDGYSYSSKNVVETFPPFTQESNYLKKNKRLLEVTRKMDAWKERTKSELAKIEKITAICKEDNNMSVMNFAKNQDQGGTCVKEIEEARILLPSIESSSFEIIPIVQEDDNIKCSQTNGKCDMHKMTNNAGEQNLTNNKSIESEMINKKCDNNDMVNKTETSDSTSKLKSNLDVVYNNQLNTNTSKLIEFDLIPLISNSDDRIIDDIKNNFNKSQIMKMEEREFEDQLHKVFNVDQHVIPCNNNNNNNQFGDTVSNHDGNINDNGNVPYFEINSSPNLIKRNNSNESISKSAANYFHIVSILKKKNDYNDSNSAPSINASPVTFASSVIDTSAARSLVDTVTAATTTTTTSKQGILKKRSSLDESRCSRSYSPDERSILVKTLRRNSLEESQHGILKQHSINNDATKNAEFSEICFESGNITVGGGRGGGGAIVITSNAPAAGTIFDTNNNIDHITPYHGILKKKELSGMSFDNCPKHVSISEAVILATAELNKYGYMSDNNEYDIKPILKPDPLTTNTPRPILKKKNSLECEEIRPILKTSRKNSREESDDNDEYIRSILKIESQAKRRRYFKGDQFETKNVVLQAKKEIEHSGNLEIQQSSCSPQSMSSIKTPLISVAERIKIVERALSTDNAMHFRNHRVVNNRDVHRERFKTQPITIEEISSAKTSYNKIFKPISSDYTKILHRQESLIIGNSTEHKLISIKNSDSAGGVLINKFSDMLNIQSVDDVHHNDNNTVQTTSSLSRTNSSVRAHTNTFQSMEKTLIPVTADMGATAESAANNTKAPILYVKTPATTMIVAEQTIPVPDGVDYDGTIFDDSATALELSDFKKAVTPALPSGSSAPSSSPPLPLLHIAKSKSGCVHLFQKDLNSELKLRLKQSTTRSSVMNLKKSVSSVDNTTIPSTPTSPPPTRKNHSPAAPTVILPNRSSVIMAKSSTTSDVVDNKNGGDNKNNKCKDSDRKDLGRLLRNVHKKEDMKQIDDDDDDDDDHQMCQYHNQNNQKTNYVKQRQHDDTLSIVNSLSKLNMGEMNNNELLKPTSTSEGESSGGQEINEIIKNSVIMRRKKIVDGSTKSIFKSKSQSQFSTYSILQSEHSSNKLPVLNVDCKFDDKITNNEQNTAANQAKILSRDSGLFITGGGRGVRRSLTQAMRPGQDQIMNGGGGSIAERLAALQKSGEDAWRKRIPKTSELDEINKCDISVPDTKLVYKSALPAQTPKMESTVIMQNKLEGGNVYDRLTKIQNASESWKNRIEQTDATKFTVAGRLQEHYFKTPVLALQFNKSNMKITPEKTILRSSNPTPLGLAKSPSMMAANNLSPLILNKNASAILNRSFSLSRRQEDHNEYKSPKKPIEKCQRDEQEFIKLKVFNSAAVQVPYIDDDDTFAKFFSQLRVTVVPEGIELSDFDAIQMTEKLNHKHNIIQGPKHRRTAKNPLKALAARKDLKNEYFEVNKTAAVVDGEMKCLLKPQQQSSTRGSSNLSIEVLTGLASIEDYKSVNLKSSTLPLNRSWLPYKPIMLLQIKGRTHVQCRLVEPKYTSINNGDCFILITRNKLYRYIGLFANVIEKSRSQGICAYIVENKDLGCIANDEIMINGDNHNCCSGSRQNEEFWRLLDKPDDGDDDDADAFGIPEPGHNDEDDLFEACLIETNTFYEFQDESLIPLDRYWGSIPKVEMLDRHKVLIFNFGSEIYVWNGKNSTANTKRAALRLAQELFTYEYNYEMCELNPINFAQLAGGARRQQTTEQQPLLKSGTFPDWCILAKLNQHMESILFKEKFLDWPEYEHDNLAKDYLQSGDDEKRPEIMPVDGRRLFIGEKYQEPNLILENCNLGRGNFYYDTDTRRHFNVLTKSVVKWRINEFSGDSILEKSYAHFYSSESYIIQWIYQISVTVHELSGNVSKRGTVGRDRCAYFCWQGSHSSVNEKGAAALLTVKIDKEKGAQLRIAQGSEPAAFIRLFKILYVHNGNKNDILRRKSEWRMFVLLGNCKSENILWEVKCVIPQLRSRTSALLINGSTGELVLWHGCKSPVHIHELSQECVRDIQECVYEEFFTENITTIKLYECKEGYESKEFFSAIGTTIDNINRELYFSLLPSIYTTTYDFTPRLFNFSSTSGRFECIEILNQLRTENLISAFPFKQESLYTARQPSLFLIDNGESLWLWQGWWPKEHIDYLENDSQIASDNRAGEMRWQSERRAAMETAVSYWNAKCNMRYQNKDTSALLHKNHGEILTNKKSHTDVSAADADVVVDDDDDDACERDDSITQNEVAIVFDNKLILGGVVWAGLEPLEFKTIFPEWIDNDMVADINKQDGRSEAVVSINEALAQLTQKIYPLSVLVARPLPEAVDPTRLEMYLTENDFELALGVGRSEFECMPLWKQTKLKKERDLF